jgi:hypothetical protein
MLDAASGGPSVRQHAGDAVDEGGL